MKNITKIILVLLIIAGLSGINACKKPEKIENTHDDAYGDVILKKMNMMGNIKYALVMFAGGEGIVEYGSKVIAPDGTTYDLHTFFMQGALKAATQASPDKPQAGDYTFQLHFSDGSTKEVTDHLEDTEIDVPQMTATYDVTTQTIQLQWTAVPNADLYCVKITELDMSQKPFYKKPQLPVSTTSYTIHIDGGQGWLRPTSELQDGQEYYVVVAAKKVEQGAEVSGQSKDFQTSSCTKVRFTYYSY